MATVPRPTLLCILDGFGLNPNPFGNAVALAQKPNFDALWSGYPHTTLVTHGERVGLPEGQMGNSEVGHLNIGAGREVEQWLLRISRALDGVFLSESPVFRNFIETSKSSKRVHLIGLASDGGVHSHIEHLKLLLRRVREVFAGEILLHLITDGRDTSPTSSITHVKELETISAKMSQTRIASISGRFFGMDRDKRWERVQKAYQAIAIGEGAQISSASGYLQNSYALGTTDEFIEPAVIDYGGIAEDDAVIFWNFREDRMRELVGSLCIDSYQGVSRSRPVFQRKNVLCFTEYDHTFKLPFLFDQLSIVNHLGEVISKAGLKQLRVAETEKYPHVTYFFNGGIETEYPGEDRVMIPSPREVKTYDQKPEMSAAGVSEAVIKGIRSGNYELIVVNFANADMVGHTGVLEAGIKAVETVDSCLGQIITALLPVGGQAVIIADHGNADQMINYTDGTAHTAHTKYPVPMLVVTPTPGGKLLDGGALCDVAPTILKLMGREQPKEMTGRSLLG